MAAPVRLDGRTQGLAEALATAEGLEVTTGVPLARFTTFRIGGPADVFVEVATEAAAARLVRACRESEVPMFVLGLGSNVLVPDDGLRGVVARFTGELESVTVEGHRVHAGAGLALARLARQTASAGLTGLEALSGFPSTLGGAVVMNAGCYGTEIVDVLRTVRVVDREGEIRDLPVEELGAAYRTTRLQGSGLVVTSALLELGSGEAAESLARIEELNRRRRASLPSGVANAGSVFRNPDGDYAGRLVEECGLKGLRRGDAVISEKHANVIVNEGAAAADDVLELMVTAFRSVRDRCGVRLRPELVLAGGLRPRWDRASSE